jgi:hypothetical protein
LAFQSLPELDANAKAVAIQHIKLENEGSAEAEIAINENTTGCFLPPIGTPFRILAALRNLGLPADSPLSALCVEMMPTLQALRVPQADGRASFNNLAGSIVADRSGFGDPAGAAVQDYGLRPLSDALGHYRILRTSPLTAVPEVC